ncbi:hypothetical protein H0H87_005901 [Tephrocybe sp. NHM501043]|nr:hypothetical protein H0H87_005901 [Tephrocybe sp. NHM501043]
MQNNATPGPSTLPRLMVPGMLDRSQNNRVRRHPGSLLSFATYDYYTARSDGMPDLEQLSLKEELYRAARVVIETLPSGVSTWRFVPRARKADGVPDEGIWPQPVEICGNFYECSQESWDIYKLDPIYQCFVRAPPMCPLISKRVDPQPEAPMPPLKQTLKQTCGPSQPPPSPRPAKKSAYFETESEDEHDDLQDMMVDSEYSHSKPAGLSSRTRAEHRKKVETDRNKRRARTAQRTDELARENNSPEVPFQFSFGTTPNSRAKSAPERPAVGKRKVNFAFNTLRTNGNHDDDETSHPTADDRPLRNTANYSSVKKEKRTRTTSPGEVKKILKEKKAARQKPRVDQRKHDLEARRLAREQERLRDLYTIPSDVEMPDAPLSQSCTVEMASPSPERHFEPEQDDSREKTPRPDDLAHDPQAAHEAAIEASRRKLAELEKDRHIWEEAAARRKERERMEEESLKRDAEARRQAMEAEKRERTRHAEEERKRRGQSAPPQAPTAEKILKERLRQETVLGWHQAWAAEQWADERAFSRYFALMRAFVDTTFRIGEASMSALDIPWPMLRQNFILEDVTSEAVADFFGAVRLKISADEFRSLVKKASLRFHPDHWKNRLDSVVNETERQAIFEGCHLAIECPCFWRLTIIFSQPKQGLSST